MDNVISLIADIGGTNIRIAITDHQNNIQQIKVYQCQKYPSLDVILKDYITSHDIAGQDIDACLAIACPVENDLISLTNLPWSFSQKELKGNLGLKSLTLINDYTAIAHAIPLLTEQQKVKIGAGEAVMGAPISICGPGTGLGVANLINHKGSWISLSGEGGHVDFAPTNQQEIQILEYLFTQYKHVSYEQLLSGLGLEQIYQALVSNSGLSAQKLNAPEITQKALDEECEFCIKTLESFCSILGAFSGNLALTLGSFGGVYVAGGIVPRFIEFLKQSQFRESFSAKGRFTDFNNQIPTFVITESQPGLLGASAYINQA